MTRFRLDPEMAAITVMIPELDLTDLARTRRLERSLIEGERVERHDVVRTDHRVTSADGTDLTVRVHRPAGLRGAAPALLYVHGGAFMLGGLHTEEERCELYATLAECVVLQVDYRLAPEHPFPAAFEDCLAAWSWMSSDAEALGVDPQRFALGGNSAGGAIAAAIAIATRAADAPPPVLQLLVNPALDHRGTSESARRFVDSPVFTGASRTLMWDAYLAGADRIDERAAPAMAEDLRGVAPAAFWLAEFDPLRDEGYDYALRLMHAGVPVGLHQYPGTFHGFDSYRMTRIGQRALDDQVQALRFAFAR